MSYPKGLARFTVSGEINHDTRSIVVQLVDKPSDEPTVHTAANHNSTIFCSEAGDGLPLVEVVHIVSDARYSLLMDWIEEAIAAALPERYIDNHHKGTIDA